MPVLPVKGIADVGVVKGASPRELPPNAWTSANNARFYNKTIRRTPVYRTFLSGLLTSTPYSFFGAHPQTASDFFLYTDLNGRVYRRTSTGSHGDVTSLTHVDSAQTLPVTYTQLGEFTIINRQEEKPWYLTAGGANFAALPAWPAGYRVAAIRMYKDFVVGLNVTKTGVNYPFLVMTSDASVNGAMPTSWDFTDPTKLATENNLTQLTTPLVDGAVLGDDFMLYTSDSIMKMSFRGDDNIFDYRDTGIGKGIINANCITSVLRKHYVFGFSDIYAHDGVSVEPIADGFVKEYVFKTIDKSKADRCFTFHDERNSTVWFCYASATDTEAIWLNSAGCNRGVGFNYSNNTWSFIDLPNVCGVGYVTPLVTASWTTISGTYAAASSVWSSFDDTLLSLPMLAAGVLAGTPPVSASAVYSFDDIDNAKAFYPALPVDTSITPIVTLRKTDADYEDIGLTLAHYKTLKSVYPQISAPTTFSVRTGYQMVPKDAITWSDYQTFDPATQIKFDQMTGGRLVSYEFKYTDTSTDFEFSALDLDIAATSRK